VIEIERRYLLRKFPKPALNAENIIEVRQGYISSETICERVSRRKFLRSDKHPEGYKKYTRNVKVGHGLSRYEFKDEIDRDFFESIWPISKGTRIHKIRYRVYEGEFTWEVDDFKDRDLYLAEIEIPSEDYKVVIPEWLERYVIQEVTDDTRYEGRDLAR
jgi:CYTH domain-containing protein